MVLDVTHDLAREIALGSEDAARDQVAFDLREPVLDLVQPRRIGGREVQMDLRAISEELLNATRLVGREIKETAQSWTAAQGPLRTSEISTSP